VLYSLFFSYKNSQIQGHLLFLTPDQMGYYKTSANSAAKDIAPRALNASAPIAIAAPVEVAAGAASVFDGVALATTLATTLAVTPVAFEHDDGTEGATPVTKLTGAH
jgi:hypothetical protein